MTTSLAQQLKKYQLPQTSVLLQDKKKPSLLFEPKEAATLKRETVYQIGIDGLEELISINPAFEQFRSTLFDITSKDVSRSVENKKFNQELNKEIRQFLLLLSPYFLLRSAHKALEWLIRRHNINEFNREDVLRLILPYHESNIFVRALQLLKIDDVNDNFFFLKALQKPGIPLTKRALMNHAAKSPYFIKFVSDFVLSMLKVHKKPSRLEVVFNFYLTVCIGSLEYSKTLTENHISQLLPSLLKGLRSNVDDFCGASFVVLARLTAKTQLSEKILDNFVVKLSQVKVDNLKTEALVVLIIIYQSQKHYTKLPLEAVHNFAERHWVPKVLQELNAQGTYIYPFLQQIIKSILEAVRASSKDELKEFLRNLLSQLKLDAFFVGTLLNLILDTMKVKAEDSKAYKTFLKELIDVIEQQYPEQFDKEVYKLLSAKDDSVTEERKKALKTLTFKSSFHKKTKYEIFQKLHHPNPHIRAEAIKFVHQKSSVFKKIDSDMIKESFLARLHDDNIDVASGALDVIKSLPNINIEELKYHLKSLAMKCAKLEEFGKLSAKVLKVLFSISSSNDLEVLPILMCYFILHPIKEANRFLKDVAASLFVKENRLIDIDILNLCTDTGDLLSAFLKTLNKNTNDEVLRKLLEINHVKSPEETDAFYKCLMLFILGNVVPQNCTVERSASVMNLIFKWFKSSPTSFEKVAKNKDSDIVLNHEKYQFFLNIAKAGNLHSECLLMSLEDIFLRTNIPEFSLHLADYTEENNSVNFFITISNILFHNYKTNRKYCKSFFNRFCPNLKNRIEFILNISISNNSLLDQTFQENAIKVLSNITFSEQDFDIVFDRNSLVVPYLLILLSSEKENIRLACYNFIVKVLDSFSNNKKGTYWLLLNGIRKHKEEILLDNQQMPLIIFNLLSPENMKNKEHVKESKEILNKTIEVCCDEKSPVYLKSGIMNLLIFINSIEIFEKFSVLSLKVLEQNKKVYNSNESIMIKTTISRLNSSVVDEIQLESSLWKFIEVAVKDDKSEIESDGKKLCPSAAVLNQIDKELFAEFTESVQARLLDLIIEKSTLAQSPLILPAASHIFKHIDLDARILTDYLVQMRDVQSSKQNDSKRRRRSTVLPTIDILDTLEWKKGVTILEFIQDKKKIRNTDLLMPLLFGILKRCLDFDEQVAVEYPKQLVLSSILNCCSKLEEQNIPESIFNMELIVQCIRASPNPQTHHHALLVLAETANLFPSQVLHHIIAIFTFMGSSLLRHDDSYSFQILTRIIDEVIPILVGDNSFDKIKQVLRVFVDAMLDVPEHRRIPLYKILLTTIQAQDNLYLFLLLVFEAHVKHSVTEKQKQLIENDVPRLLDIAANLCREFSPDVVILTCIKLIAYLKTLPDDKNDYMESDSEVVIFNIATHPPKEFRHYKYTLISFVSNLLSSKEFINQIAQMNEEDLLNLHPFYKDMIINILTFIQRISKTAERNIHTAQAQYWKVILHHSYDILDSINALLTPDMFFLVIQGLTVHNIGMVRRRALELLNSKLQYNTAFFAACDESDLLSVMPSILNIIETVNNDIDIEQETIIQTALLSLKLLVKMLAPNNTAEFKKILKFIVNIIKSGKAKDNVLASALLCLAELCANLGAHSISELPHYMPAILKILKQQKREDTPSLLLLSNLTALHKIFENLSLFMSPYIVKILCELCLLMSKYGTETDDQKASPVVLKLVGIKQKIGLAVPLRVLIPAVEQCYVALSDKNCFNSVGSLMDILAESISHLKGQELNAHLGLGLDAKEGDLTVFFFTALQFRADNKTSLEEANVVEKHVIRALMTLVLKLSESTFRSLYSKLYNWAIQNDTKSDRVITFYNLSSEISENLKAIFVLFAGYFINHAAQILDSCNETKNKELYFEEEEKNLLLLECVLKTLRNVFLYDSQKFLNKDRFEILMHPIVDQLENTLGGVEAMEERAKNLTVPCIVALTIASGDDLLWKLLNTEVLLKLRHDSRNVRLIALHCLTEIVKKLGDDFSPLVPETTPFLAEIMDDNDEEVVKASRKSIQEMNKYLGEPLEKNF